MPSSRRAARCRAEQNKQLLLSYQRPELHLGIQLTPEDGQGVAGAVHFTHECWDGAFSFS